MTTPLIGAFSKRCYGPTAYRWWQWTAALGVLKLGAKASAPFSIALLDVVMPEIDGFEVVQMIQQDAELDSAIVIMLSSLDDGSYMVRCRELDIELCIRKPIS